MYMILFRCLLFASYYSNASFNPLPTSDLIWDQLKITNFRDFSLNLQ